jgi:hypothetical protein
LGFGESELVALLSDEEEPDWTEFDNRLAALEKHSFALLPIKVPREAKRPIQEALRARAVEIGIDEKDKAVLAGRVIRKLLGVY